MDAISKLNPLEKTLQKLHGSHFKLCYQYREYHFKTDELILSNPAKPIVDISKIYNSQNVLGLILSFYISFAVSARKTAFILRSVFNIGVSYQTVLNYAESAAYHCHQFNLKNKGPVGSRQAGDETYIKISGKSNFTFFFISPKRHKITSYHVADSRETLPAIIAMNEAIRTAEPDQRFTFITDGNPSYPAGIHFLNKLYDPKEPIEHHKVIGLQNLDAESELFRPFKQLIERLNRTYKYHVRPACGFNSFNGAVALTTLFVTHYNFLRPHMALDYETPVPIPELEAISTIQGKWAKIISMAA
jgi:putative transposase